MDNSIRLREAVPRVITGLGTKSQMKIYDKKLRNPPSEETIRKTSEAFSGFYDRWMEHHHAIAIDMLGRYHTAGHIGRKVAEIGCGTSRLTSMLMLEMQGKILYELGQKGELDPHLTFICLDFSQQMLALAKINIMTSLSNLMDLVCDENIQRKPLGKDDFRIDEKAERLQLAYKGKPVINVWLACKDASRLTEVPDGDKTDTVILSYVMYWLRGLEGKLDTLRKLYELPSARLNVISLEEWPLVVRCDLHPEEKRIQQLADMIEEATTVIPMPHMRELFKLAGFSPQEDVASEAAASSKLVTPIDDFHRMYGQVFIKRQ
jgi:SAM-dependent methyltransferase